MKNPKLIYMLSLCGTSLLTNLSNNDERKLVFKYANVKKCEDVPDEDKIVLIFLIENAKNKIINADINLAMQMSAELNGIIKYYQNNLQPNGDYHLLLCTDTWLGQKTAELVKIWLTGKGFTVEVKRQADLQTEDLSAFQCALSDIVKWCDQTVLSYQTAGYKIVFNLTGGFKSVQGFLQTLATFYADETIYIFETAKELLRIPRLPVEMAATPIVEKNLKVFRRLAMDLDISELGALNIPETLLLKIDNEFTLSPWGEIVWQQSKKEIYSKQLNPSPSKKIQFAESFHHSLKNIAADRLYLVNEKVDLLTKFLEKNIEANSLDFKQVRGNTRLPSTHEIDAWSDQDAKRIFGHYEGGVFVLDKLDKKLNG
ncbi:MAG: putative CRISPR-associated protein [Methylococcales bacterium]